MRKWWRNLSVSRKLYILVSSFFIVISVELIALKFSLDNLSAVRSYLSSESRWAKAQKGSVNFLYLLVMTGDQKYYDEFINQTKLIVALEKSRLEMEKSHEEFSYKKAEAHFIEGSCPPEDAYHMITWYRNFSKHPLFTSAVSYWELGDQLFMDLINEGHYIHDELQKNGLDSQERDASLSRISQLDQKLTKLEKNFVNELQKVALLSEKFFRFLLYGILIISFFCIASALIFGRRVTRWLSEFVGVATLVGAGDFNQSVPVNSNDEFGKASSALNQMITSLRAQTNERLNAEHASLAKNIFLANMSHEIRTPLNSILGFSELLRDSQLEAKEREQYAGIIQRTGNSLMSIIRDILDIARIEAEQITIEISVFSIEQLLLDLKELLRLRCVEKGIELVFEKRGTVAPLIRSDLTRVRQILLNILGNAIKFTDKGTIHLRYYVQNDKLVFQIQDSGAGITPTQMGSLFRPFSQGDSSVRKRYGGTGLGLMISKRLAQLLGGDVCLVESVLGKGSTFQVSIDYEVVQTDEKQMAQDSMDDQAANQAAIQGKKILVVEDSFDNQLLINVHLSRCGAVLDMANDGLQGLEKCSTENYDLIIMDMQMPVMDGYSSTKKLRKRGFTVPILALTGFAMNGDEEKCLEAGCDAYLSKPFDRQKLINAVSKTIRLKHPH